MKFYYMLAMLIILSSNIVYNSNWAETRPRKYLDLKYISQYHGMFFLDEEVTRKTYRDEWLQNDDNHRLLAMKSSATTQQTRTKEQQAQSLTSKVGWGVAKLVWKVTCFGVEAVYYTGCAAHKAGTAITSGVQRLKNTRIQKAQDDSDTGSATPDDEETQFYSCATFENEADSRQELAVHQEAVTTRITLMRYLKQWKHFRKLKEQEREKLAEQYSAQQQQKRCFNRWKKRQRQQKQNQSITAIQQVLRAKQAQTRTCIKETNQQLKTFLVLIQRYARYQLAVQRYQHKTKWYDDFDDVDRRPSEQAREALWAARSLTGSTQLGLAAQRTVEVCEDVVDRAKKARTNADLWLRRYGIVE